MKQKWLLLAIIVAIAVTVFSLSHIVTDPAHVVLQISGDGSKNFYNFVYHSLYDSGWWFTGLNYPYGEHIVYADGQPFLSFITIFLRQAFGLYIDGTVAVLNLALGVGFVLGVVYMYKLLKHFAVSEIWAIIFAVLIIFLSPQIVRLGGGHYGLVYPCVIPMLLYWLMRYDAGGGIWYLGYMLLFSLVMAFMHPYFIAVSFLLVAFYSVAHILLDKKKFIDRVKFVLPPFAAILLVFSLVKLIMQFTDPITDRPAHPWGVMQYFTVMADIISSDLSPLQRLIRSEFHTTVEGFTYVGAVTLGMLALIIVASLLSRIRLLLFKQRLLPSVKVPISGKWIVVGIFALILGMGIPFKWKGDVLLDIFPILRQFRTLGRFSWIFYYTSCIYAVVYLYHLHQYLLERGKKWLAFSFIALAAIVWGYEASGYIVWMRSTAQAGRHYYMVFYYWNEKKDPENLLKEKGYKSSDFQAIVALPYCHIGSEKLWVRDNVSEAFTEGTRVSLNLELPLVNSLMSRSSWQQAFRQVRLVGGPFAHKPILDTISAKPILLIKHPREPLTPDEEYLVNIARYIGETSYGHFYALYPETIRAAEKSNADTIRNYLNAMRGTDTCISCAAPYFLEHLDKNATNEKIFGSGASFYLEGRSDVFATFNTTPVDTAVLYEFSAWALVNDIDFRSPEFQIDLCDRNGELLKREALIAKTSTDNKGFWLRASKFFKLPPGTTRIFFRVLDAGSKNPNYIAVDEMLLKPVNGLMISKDALGRVLVNNHNFVK